jgi:enterochelin esterase-like enzyme
MNKFVLTMILMAPLLISGGLYFAIPKNPQERLLNARRIAELNAPAPAPAEAMNAAANPLDEARKAAEKLAKDAADAAKGAADAAKGAADAAKAAVATGEKMLRPEFLPQGYIIVVTDSTGLSSQDSPLYLASSYNGWNPGDEKFKMSRRSDLRWQIVMTPGRTDAPIAFKFTRGSWDLEELSEGLTVIDNRGLPEVPASKYGDGKTQPIFEFTVPKWGDQRPNPALRPDLNPYFDIRTADVSRIEVAGGVVSPFKRDVLVWTPPGYNDPANIQRQYPVLYLQDGQNLFETHPGIPAEWAIDETAAQLIRDGKIEPMIIVGIPHSGRGRASEYMPFANARLGEAKPMGDWYADWVVSEVMPRVERQFRVAKGRENTVVGGASLGAIISLHIASRHPDKFRGVLVESIAPLGEDNPTLAWLKQGTSVKGMSVFYGYGLREGDAAAEKTNPLNAAYIRTFQDTQAWLQSQAAMVQTLSTDSPHNERAWAERIGAALQFLFPAKKQ